MTVAPARVFGIRARDGKSAVLFRRGPSKLTQLLSWDLKTDLIVPGQWLKLAVYPHRSDLSPDGRHLIYFAASHMGGDASNWTAISRPPCWTALHFYGQFHAWNGGGLFLDNKRYWPDLGTGSNMTKKVPCGLTRAANPPGFFKPGKGEDTVVYLPRLERDGWMRVEHDHVSDSYGGTSKWLFQRDIGKGWSLRKRFTASGRHRGPNNEIYWENHILVGPFGEITLDDEWAEVDRKSVIYASKGRLFRLPVNKEGPADAIQIADLNPNRLAQVIAPYSGLKRVKS